MSEKIKIMISSTIKDLMADRDAAIKAFSENPMVEIVGATPINAAYSGSPYETTMRLAKQCDFFVLLLGGRFGFDPGEGKSATQLEFEAAYLSDPTKIVVFKKASSESAEKKQSDFINSISEYKSGFWVTNYEYTHDMKDLLQSVFLDWLRDRASVGATDVTERFLQIVSKKLPFSYTRLEYAVLNNRIEIKILHNKNQHYIHFDRSKIHTEFWECVYEFDRCTDKIRGME